MIEYFEAIFFLLQWLLSWTDIYGCISWDFLFIATVLVQLIITLFIVKRLSDGEVNILLHRSSVICDFESLDEFFFFFSLRIDSVYLELY